ncbi:MAG: dihydroorotase [Oscillospiraceae bacterium]|nr:dihydroorotase [Oscillospiraceae bacterium]
MNYLFQNAAVYRNGRLRREDFSLCGGVFHPGRACSSFDRIVFLNGYTVFPGFADVHVHFREPGFSYKETIHTGSLAAAHGGYTAVCAMPNLKPTPDSLENLEPELQAIRTGAVVRVLPYGTITAGEQGAVIADLEGLAPHVAAFSDDGHGVQRDEIMEEAMVRAKALGKLIVAHCEDNSLLRGGYIHDGAYAAAHGHRGICSESEWGQIARDLELVRRTGCGYHVCHISTRESVALIRRAKAEGLDVTCETAPHYLLMDDSMLQEEGRFKMNPPIRGREDREALLQGLRDGTVDMVATDHAPHTAEEKSRGLAGSLMGVVGLETAFPLLYTHLVLTGELSLERLVEVLCDAPRRRFALGPSLQADAPADFTVFDLNAAAAVDPDTFLSMGRSTPFAGWPVRAKCMMTVAEGRLAYCDASLAKELDL